MNNLPARCGRVGKRIPQYIIQWHTTAAYSCYKGACAADGHYGALRRIDNSGEVVDAHHT